MKINSLYHINVIDLIKNIKDQSLTEYFIIPATPATGVLFVTYNNPGFISGDIRLRGKDEGRYPYNYPEMIDTIFGVEKNTIEVCSRSVKRNNESPCFTVDINPETKPDLVADGQTLSDIPDNKFNRWRCDPPYNQDTAQKMIFLKQAPEFAKLVPLCFYCLGPRTTNGVLLELRELDWFLLQ